MDQQEGINEGRHHQTMNFLGGDIYSSYLGDIAPMIIHYGGDDIGAEITGVLGTMMMMVVRGEGFWDGFVCDSTALFRMLLLWKRLRKDISIIIVIVIVISLVLVVGEVSGGVATAGGGGGGGGGGGCAIMA